MAELVLGEIIMLMRRIPEKSALAHRGIWRKTGAGAHEVRGKTLGIVGYRHIGSQLSILAEAIGMRVRYRDTVEKLSLGDAAPSASLSDLLALPDVVSLHVPAVAETRGMIGAREPACARVRFSSTPPAARWSISTRWPPRSRPERFGGAAVDVFPGAGRLGRALRQPSAGPRQRDPHAARRRRH